ncbi:MAG: GTPase domain-containing protein [Deltaproteobacteria bacterium]|nr:GTPase domain-containing protein [Deltaproteobacteria bacterium]
MVFFNYSTMQMAAKIVYYGPGLCGKTTNLQQIYNQTSKDSRGEMVSLETETDRTLFFDLLPIDVGTIAGFSTRIQLYTVPGQVFYNTTRKLVLKGVDGVVFVADSQRPMLQANIDSLNNLRENLAETGVRLEDLPIVLQFNKRDLPSICTAEEMNQALNFNQWPYFEAAAISGHGVFETLKGISKLTLVALKKKLARGSAQRSGPAKPTAPPRPTAPSKATAEPPKTTSTATTAPAPAGSADQDKKSAAKQKAPIPAAPVTPTKKPAAAPPKTTAAAARPKKGVDVLGELEKLRQQVSSFRPRDRVSPQRISPQNPAPPQPNGHGEHQREIQVAIEPATFRRVRRLSLNLQMEDENHQRIDVARAIHVDIQDPKSLEKVLLKLNIALSAKK